MQRGEPKTLRVLDEEPGEVYVSFRFVFGRFLCAMPSST